MFVWFHIFLAHGIANREFALLWAALKGVGLSSRLETFLASFERPKQFQGWKPNKIFGKRSTSVEPLKCSAGELLSEWDHQGLHLAVCLGRSSICAASMQHIPQIA